LLVSFKTPAPPEAKLTPLRNIEEFPVVLPMERYAGGVATLTLPAAMVEAKRINKRLTLLASNEANKSLLSLIIRLNKLSNR